MKKKMIISISLILAVFYLVSCSGSKPVNHSVDITGNYPKPLQENEKIEDWWPLKDNLEYKYKIVDTIWEDTEKAINTEFILKIRKINDGLFSITAVGFDKFSYDGLAITGNRIFVTEKKHKSPLIVFPLFDGMNFSSVEYEKEFFLETIKYKAKGLNYGPIRNELKRVKKLSGNKYLVKDLDLRGLSFEFEKGVGITKWGIPGYILELIK